MNINEYEYRERFRVYFYDTYVNISILNKILYYEIEKLFISCFKCCWKY